MGVRSTSDALMASRTGLRSVSLILCDSTLGHPMKKPATGILPSVSTSGIPPRQGRDEGCRIVKIRAEQR
eukprot:5159332-Amphidinium_carterae.1